MKNLIEEANELKEKAENIVNVAKEEKRLATEEEKKEFDSIMNQIHDIENTIEMEEKINNMETKEVKVENGLSKEEEKIYSSLQEKKDYAAFAKTIRTYSNSDPDPTGSSSGPHTRPRHSTSRPSGSGRTAGRARDRPQTPPR